MRAVAFDFPGMGLAQRPESFDYSWGGLSRWTGAALDALDVERCHLVVHDIGGPIGFEWAIRHPERVASLTALNTFVNAASFRRPWTMHPFSIRGVGEAWLRASPRFLFSELFYLQGVGDRSALSRDEVYAYREMILGEDRGRAFLKVMRGFELTEAKERFYLDGLRQRRYPAQVVWGRDDPALGSARREEVEAALGVERPILLPGKHFLQEEQPSAIADAVASLAR
jgi:pimeloyl-ACP methyl ester carboxylesterase